MKAMSMPTYEKAAILAALCLLSACNKGDDKALEKAEEQAAQQAADNGKIECALAGATEFTRSCESERIAGPNGQIAVIRHPDGGFRRFKILTDGKGLAAAEGADLVKITPISGDEIEVAIADDRYRLPANVKPNAAKPASEPAVPPANNAPTAEGG
ncbi:hypothetical protein ACFOWX_06960 [Sphingorhabdus arenilitoris]|uniref:Lipoprotein n=1 Tax=Sphingorhabdus arenilitoris TaxID=1490041 RepID=A0ABV8RIM1_9SPHN